MFIGIAKQSDVFQLVSMQFFRFEVKKKIWI